MSRRKVENIMSLLQNYPTGANKDNKVVQGPCIVNIDPFRGHSVPSKTGIQDLWDEFYSGSSITEQVG